MNRALMRVALRNVAAHKVRLLLTVLSVVLGTAFVTGSFVFTDTLQNTFDQIVGQQADGVDVVVKSAAPQAFGPDQDLIERIKQTPGVGKVASIVSGPVVLLDPSGTKAVQTGGAPSSGRNYLPPGQSVATPSHFVAGNPPAQPGDIAMNAAGAKLAKLTVGQRTKVMTPAGDTIDVTLTGTFEQSGSTAGLIDVLFPDTQARQLFSDGQHVNEVDIAAAGGVGDTVLRDRVAGIAGTSGVKVLTGTQARDDAKATIAKALQFVNYFLLAFGAIALLVGTFIIYNTFTMIVAQRMRELALLRAVGASRRQIRASVVLEAVVTGIFGSVLGILVGVGLAFGLAQALNAFQLGIPVSSMQAKPRTFGVALAVGIVVTVLSAYAPARRAAQIPPVQAMAAESLSGNESLRVRTIVGGVLGVAGIAVVAVGTRHPGAHGAIFVGVGAFALILAVLCGAPALARPMVASLGWMVRPFGAMGRLARGNAVRQPRRTAATAFALTLTVMLVCAIAMLGSSAKASVAGVIDQGMNADFVLTGPPATGIPSDAGDAARKIPAARAVVPMRAVVLRIGNTQDQSIGISPDGPVDSLVNYHMVSGHPTPAADEVLLSEDEASKDHVTTGSKITVTSMDNQQIPVTVGGVYQKSTLLSAFVAPAAIYDKVMPPTLRADVMVLVGAAPHTDPAALRGQLEQAVAPFVVVQVQDRQQFIGQQGKQVDSLLAVLYGLLALAVVIAVLGIVNTLALSVVERRREIGMLRAVGTQRAQVRRTIYLESALIAGFGAVIGVLLGIGLAESFGLTLHDLGLAEVVVPWPQVVGMLVGSVIVGVGAALWPAVRAARTPPLAAVNEP